MRLGVRREDPLLHRPANGGVSAARNTALREARRDGIALDLPPEASDIRFYQHLQPDRVVIVDFAIGEDAFLQWAERQG